MHVCRFSCYGILAPPRPPVPPPGPQVPPPPPPMPLVPPRGTCRFGKAYRIQHRTGAMKKNGDKPTKEGELMTMDWMILKSDEQKGVDGETVLQVLLDVGTGFLVANPSVKRNAEAAYDGILMLYGNRCKVKFCRMDDAKELKKACKMHRQEVTCDRIGNAISGAKSTVLLLLTSACNQKPTHPSPLRSRLSRT